MIDIHLDARISALADIEDSVRGSRIIIGANSVIDSFVKIKPTGGMGDVIIGAHTYINSGCVLYSGNGIEIGDHVAIAANCTLAPVNHAYMDREKFISSQGFLTSKGGIHIENDVWIGANCVILDGAILRCGVVVAAGSIVRGELEAFGIYAGTPLQCKGYRQ